MQLVALGLACYLSSSPCSLEDCRAEYAAKAQTRYAVARTMHACVALFDERLSDIAHERAWCVIEGMSDVTVDDATVLVLESCKQKHPEPVCQEGYGMYYGECSTECAGMLDVVDPFYNTGHRLEKKPGCGSP